MLIFHVSDISVKMKQYMVLYCSVELSMKKVLQPVVCVGGRGGGEGVIWPQILKSGFLEMKPK